MAKRGGGVVGGVGCGADEIKNDDDDDDGGGVGGGGGDGCCCGCCCCLHGLTVYMFRLTGVT